MFNSTAYQLFMRPFDFSFVVNNFYLLLPYIGKSLLVMALSVFFGSALGFLLAWGRLSHSKIANCFAAIYVHLIRCTPSIVLLFLVYYGLPQLFYKITSIRIGYNGKIFYVTITLSLIFAASMCELFRSAYYAVDYGQTEAAHACGMNARQTAWLIIIPQAASCALPVFCTELISLLKQGALAFTIGFIDLMGEAQVIVSRDYGAHGLETYIALAIIYWTLTIIIEQVGKILENLFSKGKTIPGSSAGESPSYVANIKGIFTFSKKSNTWN